MRKKRSKSVWAIILIVVTLFTSASVCFAAEKELTKEYTFQSSSADFNYKAKKTIKEDGKQYNLKGITYKVLSADSAYIERDYTYRDLAEKKVPLKKTFRIDGEKVSLTAEEADIRYSERIETITEHISGATSQRDIPENKKITTEDGILHDAELTGLKEESGSKPYTATVKFIGEKGTTYYLDGKKLVLKGDGPIWNECKRDVIDHLGLADGSTVSGGTWTSGYQRENGQTVRYARITGTVPTTNYTATYSYKLYSTTVTYSNGVEPGQTLYTAQAICNYEKAGMSALRKIIYAGVGLLLLAGLTVLILYVIARKKRIQE